MAFDAGTGFIDIRPDLTRFAARLQSGVAPVLDRLGSRLSSAGKSLTRSVSVPLAVAGGAAVAAALTFEDAFTRISAVSNASAESIAQWRGEVLQLAGKTAQAPAELAEALFFLASAGLDAEQIMPTLEASAKAAASGLGETADVARLTANVLNAYADTGLTAAQATDVLVAAVREGSAEPDEFADAMGRILPVASKAGVEFDQIAASLAAVSNIGLDVNEGVTAMRGLLSALLAPGTQAADTIKEIGLTADGLRDSLAEDGLIATLRLLDEAAEGDIDTLRKIIPNIRAMTGAFGLTEQEARKVDDIFRKVADSTGSLKDAFEETEKGPAFRFRQSLQKLQVTAIQLGQKLLPIVQDVLKIFTDLAKKFQDLDPHTQNLIVKFGLLAFALGPVLRLLGGITSIASSVIRALAGIAGALAGAGTASVAGAGGAASTALLGIGAAPILAGLAAVAGAVVLVGVEAKRSEDRISGLVEELQTGVTSVEDLIAETDALQAKVNAPTPTGARAPGRGGAQQPAARQEIDENSEALRRFAEQNAKLIKSLDLTAQNQQFLNDIIESGSGLTEKQVGKLANHISALELLGGGLSDSKQRFVDNLAATGNFGAALDVVRGKLDKLTARLQKEHELRISTRNAAAQMNDFLNSFDGRNVTVGVSLSGPGSDFVLRGGGQGGAGGEHGLLIPGAAQGQFIDRHQLIQVGEKRKKEAVIPLEDPAGIAAMAKAFTMAFGSGAPTGGDVYLDGEKVGRWVSKQQGRRRALVGA